MLVADLIELARGDEPSQEREDVRLDELVREAVTRAKRHAPSIDFRAALEPAVLDGTRERLARAVNNLLDNAAKHSPPGGIVEVHAGPSGVRVRDHGTGVDPRGPPPPLRPLLPRRLLPRPPRLRPRPRHRPPGRRTTRRHRPRHQHPHRRSRIHPRPPRHRPGRGIPLANLKGPGPFRLGGEDSASSPMRGDDTITSSRLGRRSAPRLRARLRSSADLRRRSRSQAVSRAAGPHHTTRGVELPVLLPDGQPHAPAHRDARAEPQPRDAAAARGICPGVQPSPRHVGPRFRRALQRRTGDRPTRSFWRRSPTSFATRVDAGLCRTPEDWPWSSHASILRRPRRPGSTSRGCSRTSPRTAATARIATPNCFKGAWPL